MPVLIGEVCYEGIQEASRQEVQRFMFWSALLSGTAGHTYGANGIWQVNTRAATLRTLSAWPLLGRSRVGHSCATSRLGPVRNGQGSAHRYSWWKLEAEARSHRTALEQKTTGNPSPGKFPAKRYRVLLPHPLQTSSLPATLEAASIQAFFFNPSDGKEIR